MTRRVTFAATYRYWRADWSRDRHRTVFGACTNPVGHGHAYAFESPNINSVSGGGEADR